LFWISKGDEKEVKAAKWNLITATKEVSLKKFFTLSVDECEVRVDEVNKTVRLYGHKHVFRLMFFR
jgi:hypothetical protein